MAPWLLACLCALCASMAGAKQQPLPAGITRASATKLFNDLAADAANAKSVLVDSDGSQVLLVEVEGAASGGSISTQGQLARGLRFNINTARRLLSYNKAIRCKYTTLANWTCTDCQAYGASTQFLGSVETENHLWDGKDPIGKDAFMVNYDPGLDAIVLTFRSTMDSVVNWLNNFLTMPKLVQIDGKNFTVHTGFYRTYYEDLRHHVARLITEAVAKVGAKQIYVIGHSRGGALATLAALDLVSNGTALGLAKPSQNVRLFTAGQPRVGGLAFAKYVESRIQTRWRLVNNADIVPATPPNKALDSVVRSALKLVDSIFKTKLLAAYRKLITDGANYTHHGPYLASINTTVSAFNQILVCPKGESAVCAAASFATLALGRPYPTRPKVIPVPVTDHGPYLGVDMGNTKCMYGG